MVINVIMVINVFQVRYLEWPILCRHQEDSCLHTQSENLRTIMLVPTYLHGSKCLIINYYSNRGYNCIAVFILILTVTSHVVYYYVMLQQTFEQWRIVFWIMVATYMCGALVFLIFGTTKTQSWNSSKQETAGVQLFETEIRKPLKSSLPS